MNTMLVLNINPALEEDMVDYLLAKDIVQGFTSYRVNGHGDNLHMTVAEQVSGRRRRLQFELILDQQFISEIISGLSDQVGVDIAYWQQPITDYGKL